MTIFILGFALGTAFGYAIAALLAVVSKTEDENDEE